ncbi:type II toxin-antitoxin system VapC family toxin [Desulfobacterota bacterium AH_259_B03_O07]|nr:type II toxin-antitoxin system VapC family toxin [Desulfobacterota bacterium AH_259_B03_O07]
MDEIFVIDNSVVMSWCFKDESNNYGDIVLDNLQKSTAVVPPVWPLEVANVLLVAERRKRLSEADTIRFVTLLNQLPITVEEGQSEKMMLEILALAREHKLSSYDASYLDLAMRKGLSIATLDRGLRAAAKKTKVQIFKH